MIDRIKVKGETNHPKYFIKDLVNQKIELFSIEQKENSVELIINQEDYKKLLKMKTIRNLKVINTYGKSKIIYLFKHKGYYLLLFLFGILLNILFSNLIFQVEVETPNQELQKQVLKDLKELGIEKYRFKPSYEKVQSIKKQIKEKESSSIEWMEIEESGTKYIVKVEEKKQNEKEVCYPRNIIAKKKAILTRIESSEGEVSKKKQDYVEKGEVVISGLIHNKERIVSKRCATGTIYGETWYKVIVELPKEKTIYQETNKKQYSISLKLFQKEWTYPSKPKISQKNEYNIIKSNILPFQVSFQKQIIFLSNKELYTKQEWEEIAFQKGIEELEKHLSAKPNILRKNVLKKTTKNSKIIIEVFFAIEEDITDYQDITEIDIEKENQIKEG